MLNQELQALSIDSDIATVPDASADINHHIIYWYYDGRKSSIDTVMITHIDTFEKLKQLKEQLNAAEMGICMSRQTMDQLSASGVPRERLCFVNPAHDNIIRPRKTVIGITSKVHYDGRKRENHLIELTRNINPDDFAFKIMGSGWQSIVDYMKEMGFTVEYHEQFDYVTYVSLIQSLDYYLYLSFDEGSMGILDALAAGVKTIVTPQGYHLDAPGGITYPVNDMTDILAAFEKIVEEKHRLVNAVSSWTWADYTRKHVDIWEYLIRGRDNDYVRQHGHKYPDGLCSILHDLTPTVTTFHKLNSRMQFVKNSQSYYNFIGRCKNRFKTILGK
jgi:glycosyltransferase involved in cell wall biosynthesis